LLNVFKNAGTEACWSERWQGDQRHQVDLQPPPRIRAAAPYEEEPGAGTVFLAASLSPRSVTQLGGSPLGPAPEAKTPRLAGLSLEADEGIRTLDLRHGKATL
jgi:hypothetical protein